MAMTEVSNREARAMLHRLVSVTGLRQKTCRECHHNVERPSQYFAVDCQTRGLGRLEDAISQMTAPEVMEGNNKVYCGDGSCLRPTDHVLQMVFDGNKLPHILRFNLKRFDLDRKTFKTIKINHRFAFPNRLDMELFCLDAPGTTTYELVGVVVH